MKKDLQRRTRQFAIETIRFSGALTGGMEQQIIKRQLIRAGSSVGANYRAACRARSRKDFISRIGIVAEEGDEVQYWLELLEELGTGRRPELRRLKKEASEIVAIMVASINTARSRTDPSSHKSQITTHK